MTTTTAVALLLLAATGASPPASAQKVASASLPNGASIAFAVLRTGPESAPAPALGESVLSRRGQNVVTRVLQDRATGAYFGYQVEVDRSDDPPGFQVTFSTLEPREVEAALRRTSRPGDPEPRPLSAPSPRFPSPQRIVEGEVLTLELLTNPSTGERIYDVIKVSARPVSASALEAAVARARDGQAAERRAAAHVARGRYWEAVEEYRRALEIQPRDATLHNKLGICYQQLGVDAVAEREYREALAINPSYAEVWNNIGTLEQQRSHLKEAARAYRKAIRLKRELATPWKNLGNVYLALERPDDAFEAYQEAFRLDPTIVENPGVGIPAAGVDAATQNFYIAKLLANHAQIDAALDFLRRARDAGFRDWDRVRADPDFEAVVADPRFEALLEK